MSKLDELKALMEKASKTPWEICGATHLWSPSDKANVASCSALRTIDHVGYAPPSIRDIEAVAVNADLIAAAINSLPALLACAETLGRFVRAEESFVANVKPGAIDDPLSDVCEQAKKALAKLEESK